MDAEECFIEPLNYQLTEVVFSSFAWHLEPACTLFVWGFLCFIHACKLF